MEKPTKRKAFNFLRSYFDVVNELQNDTDKCNFLMAIINKQFLDEDPEELSFIVNLCYSSQKHSIEASVKGWKRVSNTDMEGNPLTDPTTNPPTNPPIHLPTNPLEVEVKGEVEVKEELKVKPEVVPTITVNWEALLKQFNDITGKQARVVDDKSKRQFLSRLKEGYTKIDIVNAITNCFNSEFHKSNGHKNLTLEFISRPDKFAMYFDFKETIVKPIKQDRL